LIYQTAQIVSSSHDCVHLAFEWTKSGLTEQYGFP
jgi:hypothetical protein